MAKKKRRLAKKASSASAAKRMKLHKVQACTASFLGKASKASRTRRVKQENGAILVTYSPRGAGATYKEIELHIGSSMQRSVRRMIEDKCKAG